MDTVDLFRSSELIDGLAAARPALAVPLPVGHYGTGGYIGAAAALMAQ